MRTMGYVRSWAIISAVVLVALLLPTAPAGAGHGSWHHNHHISDPSPSQYRAYAHTYSTQNNDFVHARIVVVLNGTWIINKGATCGPVNEGCRTATSPSGYWSQGGYNEVVSHHCGYDGSHRIDGISMGWTTCTVNGEETHMHATEWYG